MSNPLPLLTTAREVTLHDARERLAAGAAAAACRRRRLDVEAERTRELDAAVGQLRPALQAHVNRDVISNRRSRIRVPQIIASDEKCMYCTCTKFNATSFYRTRSCTLYV